MKGLKRLIEKFLKNKTARLGFPAPANSMVDFEKWGSFARQADYLSGYFDFPLYDPSSDTSAKRIRSLMLLSIVDSIVESGMRGNFAECGCYKGHSSFAIASILKRKKFKEHFYIFDSFEGLSEPDEQDLDESGRDNGGPKLRDLLAGDALRFKGDYDQYLKVMNEFEFLDVKKGWIPERFCEVDDREFAFVHIDVDVYQPTLDSLQFFYQRLQVGGFIVIDDYARPFWPGCDLAVKEFLRAIPKNEYRFIEIPMGGAIITRVSQTKASVEKV